MSRIKELISVSNKEIHNVRNIYNKTENDIQEDIKILLEWLNKQPHLPKPHDEIRLERFLLRNKFRIEQTKTKLDNYYSFKILYPEFYTPLDLESPDVKSFMKSTIYVPLPKLSPNSNRLFYWEPVENQEGEFNFLYLMRFVFMNWELQLTNDYNNGDVFVCNMKYFTLKHLSKIDLNLMHKTFMLFQEAFSGRISNIHYFGLSPAFDMFLGMIKRILSTKIIGKIQLHKNLESLHEAVPKEYLPEEAGGSLKSARDINDDLIKEMIFQKDFLQVNIGRVSNEALRVGKVIRNDLFGIDGTFKKINLD